MMLMEYMDLGSLETILNKLGGTIPEAVIGRIAFSVYVIE